MQGQIDNDLVHLEHYSGTRLETEKRLSLFNDNFMDIFRRVVACEKEEGRMRA